MEVFSRRWIFFFFLFTVVLFEKYNAQLSTKDITSESRIKLVDNGYEDIVVAISPDVKQDSVIIEQIKKLIRSASLVLYRVTGRKFYLKSVRILIPESWSNVLDTSPSDWETYETADIRVGPGNWEHKGQPFTLHASGCGQPGEYIYLSPEFLRAKSNSKNNGSIGSSTEDLIREWAKYRYGIITNNVVQLDDLFSDTQNLYFTEKSDTSVQNVPSLKSFLHDPQRVVLDDNAVPKKTGISSVKGCGLRTAWSILQEHPDYKLEKKTTTFKNTTFRIVQLKAARIVLVMDVSGSMAGARLVRLRQSATKWIRNEISDASYLGLVEFNGTATTTSSLMPVKDNREFLISKLPNFADGRTCIGCGLRHAIKVLDSSGKTSKGGVVVLISDGEENELPNIATVTNELVKSEVRVISVAYGSAADLKIEQLAKLTSGRSFFVNEKLRADVQQSSVDQYFKDALDNVLSYQPATASENILVPIAENYHEISSPMIRGSFDVDSTVGRNFELSITVTPETAIYPNNVRYFRLSRSPQPSYGKDSLSYDNQGTAKLKLQEAPAGKWTYELQLTNTRVFGGERVVVEVKSQSRKGALAPIIMGCFFDEPKEDIDSKVVDDRTSVRVYASIMQGSNPVLWVKNVNAYVETPNSMTAPIKVQLLDTTSSPVDAVADDGIYTGVFSNVKETGRYIVTCVAEGDDLSYVKDGVYPNNVTRPGNFKRFATAGSFMVTQKIINNMRENPPGRITDLRLFALDQEDWQFAVEFTAPGDRLYSGTVKSYDVIYSSSIQALSGIFQGRSQQLNGQLKFVDSSMLVWGSLNPEPAGLSQRVGIKLKRHPSEMLATYYFVVRGVGSSGKRGPPSNVLPVRFKLSPATSQLVVTEPTEPTEIFITEPDVITEPDPNVDFFVDNGAGVSSANNLIIIVYAILNISIMHIAF